MMTNMAAGAAGITAELFHSRKGLAADQVESARSRVEEKAEKAAEEGSKELEESKVQPEELLESIKALAQNGAYSVRFEKNNDIEDVVVQIWDNEAREVLRQFPAEELVAFRSAFNEIIGNFVDTKG